MTPQEAIQRLKQHNEHHSKKERFAVYITEAIQMAIEALEKQIPKKVEFLDGGDVLLCPCCGFDLMGSVNEPDHDPYYCFECGQALDWSNDNVEK